MKQENYRVRVINNEVEMPEGIPLYLLEARGIDEKWYVFAAFYRNDEQAFLSDCYTYYKDKQGSLEKDIALFLESRIEVR